MNNLFEQAGKVSLEDRCRLMGQRGLVVWFTGLSGAGKSTIAIEAERLLYEQGVKTFLLDGDNIRLGINSDLGFSDGDRNENIRRITEIAKLFCDAGIVTLVSFISPFAEARGKAKALIGAKRFIEVYVKASLETCRGRDPKGLYKKNVNDFTGIDSTYEPPTSPSLTLDTEKLSVDEAARLVVKGIENIFNTPHS
jgi:adenylyl-sulfate kinase